MKVQHSLMLGLILAVGAVSAQTKPDFSGTWKLDTAKSDPVMSPPGMEVPPDAPQVVIQQTATEMTVDQGNGKVTYKLDGSESSNVGIAGPQVTKSSWDGNSIVTTGSFSAPNMEMEFKDTRSLSEDGKTLTVVSWGRIANMGEASRTRYYTK